MGFVFYNKSQLQLELLRRALQIMLNFVRSCQRVSGFRMIFSRGTLNTLDVFIPFYSDLNDQWWFWQIELFHLGFRKKKFIFCELKFFLDQGVLELVYLPIISN